MKESEGTQDSKTNPSSKNEEYSQDEDGDEEVDQNNMPKNGTSSSNSTVEENDKKAATGSGSSVRQYIRSKNPRLRWTPDLHLRFIHAIERLGGQERATPKLVLQLMNIKGLNISHVKSHLQMYRSKKLDNPNQAISDQDHGNEGGDHHVYNLSQLPMLQGFNQRPNIPTLRYGDDIWSRRHLNPMYSASYRSQAGRIYESKNLHSNSYNSFIARNSSFGSWRSQIRNNTLIDTNLKNELEEREKEQVITSTSFLERPISRNVQNGEDSVAQKRKGKDLASNLDLDLNLSLKTATKNGDGVVEKEGDEKHNHGEIGSSNLCRLSLFTSSSSSTSLIRKNIEDDNGSRKHARIDSTLDLTL